MKFKYKLMAGMLVTSCIAFCIAGIMLVSYAFKYSLAEEEDKCIQNFSGILNTIKIAGDNTTSDYADAVKDIISQLDSRKYDEYEYIEFEECGNEDIDESGDVIKSYIWKENDKYYYRVQGYIKVGAANSDEVVEVFRLSVVYDITSPYIFRENELKIYYRIMGGFIIISVIVSFVFSNLLTRPIYKLSKVVRKIASGDIHARANIRSSDEIEKLSEDVNEMADQIEDDIKRLEENVIRQEQFMGSFAHEMKTPMTSIIGYADLMRSHDLSPAEMRESANYIFNEGKRLEALSFKMLELIVVDNDGLVLNHGNPASVVNNVGRSFRFTLQKKKIILKMSCENADVMMDKDLFASLITNLIDNAAKSIDNGGQIHVLGRKKGDKYIIQIKDNGRGMTKEELARITEAFYRADKSRSRAQGGAGLGLAICDKIVKLHNAVMQYKSEPAKGTIVQIILKQAEDRNMG